MPGAVGAAALVAAAAAAAPSVWPLPSNISVGTGARTPLADVHFSVPASDTGVLGAAADRYRALIVGGKRAPAGAGAAYAVALQVADPAAPLSPGSTDESYTITAAGAGGCTISAPTAWGALRGLETFSQLVEVDGSQRSLPPPPISVSDAPRFRWRGLMIDTGRNYLTTTTIKMALDAMSYTKLNVLHWHMVDDQSFAVESAALPGLAGSGAFSPKHTYSRADIKEIVAYASARGIAVLPELDMPGHTSSWMKGYPELRTRCSAVTHGFTPPMDPTANGTYDLVERLLADLDPLFPDTFPFWHLGGDEVNFGCWQNSDGGYVDAWMKAHGMESGDYPALQALFEQKVVDLVRGVSGGRKRTVLWEDNSAGHTSGLPKDAVVNLWKERKGDASVLDATVTAGWDVVYTSPDWYLDHWLGVQHPHAPGYNMVVGSWEFCYTLDPYENSTLPRASLDKAVLGGEVCAWAPYFDSTNFMTQAFPRTAAVAERLWSAASVTDIGDAQVRLHAWRCRLLTRGLATAPVYGGVPVGADGKPPSGAAASPTQFGGYCAEGPWEAAYDPPFAR